jgi:hypothetical protein
MFIKTFQKDLTEKLTTIMLLKHCILITQIYNNQKIKKIMLNLIKKIMTKNLK